MSIQFDYGRPHVWVSFLVEDGMYVVGDEDGEFARAGSIELALPYVRDLLYGPGTLADGGLAQRTEAAE